ncbi:MAG TPA: bifunctional proline dehydrogenase/L-glutamate gamma-semialdehyde dehydrogenase PutA [Casimicrobiaceae bacterium]|nr:bifunctional proline dehydrogenase/L-glutamate gamma-semialdehyde dehydrogenase PutA [Casimicrobiaceae bacterium]
MQSESTAYQLSRPQDSLRDAITAATRIPEAEAVGAVIANATLDESQRARARIVALDLAAKVRAQRRDGSGADALVHAFSLSSDEGVALMCLAEALLRIPDAATADALIRDKIGKGDWRAQSALSESLFVNAACWGLAVTGKLVASPPDAGLLARALSESLTRLGEPVIRAAMRAAMRFLGEQFVLGETIDKALERAEANEARGYRYSYDMLGEAALTAADADRYLAAYTGALHAIGRSANKRGVIEGPGLSVKLSALHPRYSRSQRDRVMAELLPRVQALAALAKRYDIGLNIDAEEADRLELSLDIIEALANDAALRGWKGLGVVVQAYQKRAPRVLEWLFAIARTCKRRILVRLVKGAYWDSEIKRSQVEGYSDYPVYTRKIHTDVAYLACARMLLDNRALVFPQFATHNAATLASVLELAGNRSGFEFQCLHGMGEPLYDHVVGSENLDIPCRIYAPVGTHETLLAYLVRRLLENGANTSFVNQVVDPDIDVEKLVADPVIDARRFEGSPHPRIPLPAQLYGDRQNSAGIDLASEHALAKLEAELAQAAAQDYRATPLLADSTPSNGPAVAVVAPADSHVVGKVIVAMTSDVDVALRATAQAVREWSHRSASERAAVLDRAADLLEYKRAALIHLAIREAGKSLANAIGEVREASDFCRYYAGQLRKREPAAPLGTIAAISPWNFPLAIFVGQVVGALAAGNAVVAKAAEQTPLIAHEAVRLLHEAGVPRSALQSIPGDGAIGAALVDDPRVHGVVFTGSTDVAMRIHRTLAKRGNLALVAETGGQNAMIVDASALPEQVVVDVLASAFDSAGQRCSALRVLCVQHEIAERVIAMLAGAMNELRVSNPMALSTDVGPIIDKDAKAALEAHIARMEREGKLLARAPLDAKLAREGTYLAPVAFEIPSLATLTNEVFGPVLHVLRYRTSELDALIDALNATGYALTLGIHSRIDERVQHIAQRVRAGNVYVNRNIVGAVVGVQPFGGDGLSGTGPKAGGPLYLSRLTRSPDDVDASPRDLDGPTGETNHWRLEPRGLLVALGGHDDSEAVWGAQVDAALATGNRIVLAPKPTARAIAQRVAASFTPPLASIDAIDDWSARSDIAGALAADPATAAAANRKLAAREGARLPVIEPAGSPPRYPHARLSIERTLSLNTTAAGGNASLVAAMD